MTTRGIPKHISTDSKILVKFSTKTYRNHQPYRNHQIWGTLQGYKKKQQKLFYQSFRNISIIVTLVLA